MREVMDVPYSRLHVDRRRMDLFLPDGAGKGHGAAMLLVHGGGFDAGDKAQWHEVARHFCGLGYVCASPEYRLAPAWRFPAWVEDVRLAMDFLRCRAGEYGFAPDRIAATGSSAGGYLVLMLGTIEPDDDLARSDELTADETRPNAVLAYCPATRMHESRRDFPRVPFPKLMPAPEAEAPELYKAASVEDRITGREPPILFLHGTADTLIPHAESVALCERINAAGGHAEIQLLEGVAHGFGYGVHTDAQKQAAALAEEFLEANL